MKPLTPYLGMLAVALATGCAMETETEVEELVYEEEEYADDGAQMPPPGHDPGSSQLCGRDFGFDADGNPVAPVLCDPFVEHLPGTDEEELHEPLLEPIYVDHH